MEIGVYILKKGLRKMECKNILGESISKLD